MTDRIPGRTGSGERRRSLLGPMFAAVTAFRQRLPRRHRSFALWTTVAVLGGLVLVLPAAATHPEASLPGSNFEIDIDANLKVDDLAPSIDWASVTEIRKTDLATGSNDDSYAGGAKEDDTCPGTTTGSIPNNKSDLLTFGAYVEPETGGPGFLHLFWTRVQEPTGTTLMDFELNKSGTDCGNGVNPVRTVGDLLIEYRIEQGGAIATLRVREWNGSAWGAAQDLSAVGAATGTINSSPIPVAESDGLSTTNPLSPRTFGEASLDLSFILDQSKCESFGSAFLKSRASDAFNSQLKDFIKPAPVQIANCGSVKITKTNDASPPSPLAGAEFTLYKSDGDQLFEPGTGDPVGTDANGNPLVCTTGVDGTCTLTDILFGGYWVDETVVPSGHNKASGLPVLITVNSTTTLVLGPFVNPRERGSILVKKVDGSGNPLDGAQFALDADGDPATTGDQTPIPLVAGQTAVFCIDNLLFGTYTVVETVVPGGFDPETVKQTFTVSTESTCAGRDVTAPDLTFRNVRRPGAILITKTAKDKSDPSGSSGVAGVTFEVKNSLGTVVGSPVTDANGQACIQQLVVGETYTVTETGVPAGFVVDPSVTGTVTVTDDATCGSGDEDTISFSNDPLSKITVTFASLAQGTNNGRTAATIDCASATGPLTADPVDGTPGAFDDTSEAFTNLEEGTYTCTIVIDP
jgi:hypothetical protein